MQKILSIDETNNHFFDVIRIAGSYLFHLLKLLLNRIVCFCERLISINSHSLVEIICSSEFCHCFDLLDVVRKPSKSLIDV